MIPDSFIEELKYRTDLVQLVESYTALKRTGRTMTGLCPFHNEKTPSFVLYPENGSFYCFGCGAGGDAVTFVRRAEHLEYVEALRFLAQRAGMTLPEDAQNDESTRLRMRILELNRVTARFFHAMLLSPCGKCGLEYLQGRGLWAKTIRHFGLGYAPNSWNTLRDHLIQKGFSEQEMLAAAVVRSGGNDSYDLFRDRVIFPIMDLRGNVIGFGGRILGDGNPKYLNSADTPVFKKSRGLFALNFAKATKRPQLLLCEGYMDAIAVHQAGFDNAVATLGTALTSEQARLMSQYTGEVVIAYDADAAGQKATARATEILSQTGMKLRVLSMKGAKDPDEYIRTQGVARFSQLIEGSANATEFAVSRLREHFDLDTDDGKVGFLREFCALAAALPSPIEADIYITRLAGELGVSREAISAQTTSLRKKRMRERAKKIERTPKIYAQDIPNQPRDIQRSQNMRYALAEDKLIAILLRNPDYYDQIAAAITPAQFVTDSNRTILEALFRRLSSGGDAGLMSLSGEMTPDQMSHLAHLMNSGTQGNTLREAQDCIAVILEKAAQKTDEQVGMMDAQELMNFVSGIAAKKK